MRYNTAEQVPVISTEIPDEHTPLLLDNIPSFTETFYQKISKTMIFQLLPSILIGGIFWFAITPTDELTTTSIHLLAVFISCIFALITTSVDISVLVLTALTILSVTQSFQCRDHLTNKSVECRLCGQENLDTGSIYECNANKDSFHKALEGFSSSVVWLIFSAFHLGKAVQVTQLGRRISLIMIQYFGKRTIGLGYAIVISELLLAPFVPSNTARGGGIVLPVVNSIATTLGSTPTNNPKLGGFLTLVGSHANLLSASMYLTGMAPNPIVLAKANQLFPDLHFGFSTWITGSIVPALACAIALPLFLAWSCNLHKSTVSDSEQGEGVKSDMVEYAKKELNYMGSMSSKEKQLCLVLLTCLTLWVTSGYTKMDSTLVALIGIVSLLHMGTLGWKDVAGNTSAWENLFWLGGFVTIATQLSEAGASAFLGHKISSGIQHMNLPAVPALGIAYFLTTFLFSSLSAHTVAFVGTFLDAGHALGANPMILTCLLGYFGALGGSMTNFSTGSTAMYFASGYVPRVRWFIIGSQVALMFLVVYFTIGMVWWKNFLGWT